MLFSKPFHRVLSSSIARLLKPRFLARRIVIPGAFLVLLEGIATKGATYTWTNPNGGSWSSSTNWSGGGIPANPGDIADFSELGLSANEAITLDANQTAGALLFGDTSNSFNTTVSNGTGGPWTLTLAAALGSPVINVADETTTISAILAGNQGFTKTGAGNLTLTGANTYTGTTTVSGGTLALDFSQAGAPASNIISNTTPANLALSGGGNLTIVGNPSATTSQSFAGLAVSSGADTITLNQNGATSVTLALGAITQTVGGTLNFPTVPNTGTLVVTTTNSNVNGILGSWATVGTGSAAQYATVNGSGDIVGYTGATTANGALAQLTSATSNYVFTAAGTLTASRTANTLQYNGVGTTTALAANTLTLNGLLNSGSGTLTFSSTTGGIQIGSTNELIIQGGSVTIKAPISNNGSNASSLTYSGTGTLTLNTTASTYTGTTTVNNGTLTLGLANVLASASSLVDNGGTVGISTFSQSVSGVTLTSGAINGTTGTLTSASAFNLQSGTIGVILNGSVPINKTTFGTVTISKAATLGTSGVNIAAGTITLGVTNALTNGNNVTLGNSSANTGGILNLNGFSQTIGVLAALGTGQNIVTNNAAAGSPSVFTIGGASTFGGVIQDGTGGVSLVKSNGATVTLTGANTFTGGTTVNNGKLVLAGGNNILAATGAVFLGSAGSPGINDGTLVLGSSAGPINQTVASIARTASNTATGQTIDGGYYSAATPGTFSNLTVNYTNTSTPDAYVGFLGSGTAGSNAANNLALTKTGAGDLVLSPVGANTYIAGTNINGGTLTLGASGALPAGGVVNLGGGTLDLGGFNSSVGAVTLVNGSIVNSTGTATLSGSSYAVQSGTISAVLADGASPSALTKTTSGIVTLSGQNTYSGGTFINGGTLTLGTANALPVTGAVTVAGGLLDLGGYSATVGTVTLTNGGIINSGGGATLTGSGYVVQSGTINAILGGAGSTLTKSSSGTVTLTAANTYTGLTSVNAGVLNVSSQQVGGGAFSVSDGSALNVNLAAAGQSLLTSALTIGTSTGGTLFFGLGTFGNPTVPVINTGTLTLTGTNNINVTGGASASANSH
jgi:autotransporter-associated beta strand protein